MEALVPGPILRVETALDKLGLTPTARALWDKVPEHKSTLLTVYADTGELAPESSSAALQARLEREAAGAPPTPERPRAVRHCNFMIKRCHGSEPGEQDYRQFGRVLTRLLEEGLVQACLAPPSTLPFATTLPVVDLSPPKKVPPTCALFCFFFSPFDMDQLNSWLGFKACFLEGAIPNVDEVEWPHG
jgi:hypothetical protein